MNTKDIISKPEISFWVPIIIAIVSAAMSFAVLGNRVTNNEKDLVRSELRVDIAVEQAEAQFNDNNKTLLDIQIQLAEIQKDILYIKENMRK